MDHFRCFSIVIIIYFLAKKLHLKLLTPFFGLLFCKFCLLPAFTWSKSLYILTRNGSREIKSLLCHYITDLIRGTAVLCFFPHCFLRPNDWIFTSFVTLLIFTNWSWKTGIKLLCRQAALWDTRVRTCSNVRGRPLAPRVQTSPILSKCARKNVTAWRMPILHVNTNSYGGTVVRFP